jgi:hypothetical protein
VRRDTARAGGQVAECLVRELEFPDEKNIRRRVYDALNVLMAMGIITKNKKTITWVGLPGGMVRWADRRAPRARIA